MSILVIAGAVILCALILATTSKRWSDPELGAWRRRRDEMRNVRRMRDDMNRRPD